MQENHSQSPGTTAKSTTRHPQKDLLLKIKINHAHYVVDPDSGSDVCLLDQRQFKEINQNGQLKLTPLLKRDKIRAVNGQKLDLVGKFTALISSPSTTIKDTFYVQREDLPSPPIISEHCLLRLGMMKYCPQGSFATKTILVEKTELQRLKEKYPQVFNKKLGCFKGFKVDLKLDKTAEPSIARPRVLPLHLELPTRKAIDEFVSLGILEWTPAGTPIRYCSAIVVVPKKNKAEVRLCTDFRQINDSLARTRVTSKLTLDCLMSIMGDVATFFRLDIRHAYYTIQLTDRCKALTSIATPWGTLQFCRLPMGIKSSSDYFDQAMASTLAGVPRVISYRDDILGGGRSKSEHDETLRLVIERLAKHGFTIDPAKSLFYQQTVTFLGYKFSQSGIQPDPQKVAAIRKTARPATKEALISFLCSVAYNDRFIHRFAEKAAKLHDLARTPGTLSWTPENTQIFEEIKNSLMEEAMNLHFDQNKQTAVFVDAGKKAHTPGERGGFSGILCQRKTEKDPWEAVSYGSKRMTDVQSRYGQTELEATAIGWALSEKFHYFLTGCPEFLVYTDCKALLPLWNSPNRVNIPPRIERNILKCQDMTFRLLFCQGTKNPADFFSRNPVDKPDRDQEDKYLVKFVRSLETEKPPITHAEIRRETASCPTLTKVIQNLETNQWPKDKTTQPYVGVRDELSFIDGMLFKNTNIVVPATLQSTLMKKAHKTIIPPESLRPLIAKEHHAQGHQGIKKTIQLLRRRYWWPGHSTAVEEMVKGCPACQFITPSRREEPLTHEALPPTPFFTLSADFKGPLASLSGSGTFHVLVIKCLYSRWVETYITSSTSFRAVKKHFTQFFAQHGDCRYLKTDGGPPFNGVDFEDFAKARGFKHKKTTPLNPRENGEVESFMKKIKKAYTISKMLKLNFEEELKKQVMAYRATPHSTTQKSPAELSGKISFAMNQLGDSDTQLIPTPSDREEVQEIVTAQKAKNERSGRNIKPHDFQLNDKVIVRLDQSPLYDTSVFVVEKIKGKTIVARNAEGKEVRRNSERFKHYMPDPVSDVTDLPPETEPAPTPQEKTPVNTPTPRHTRAKGPVEEQPWIFTKERSRKKK